MGRYSRDVWPTFQAGAVENIEGPLIIAPSQSHDISTSRRPVLCGALGISELFTKQVLNAGLVLNGPSDHILYTSYTTGPLQGKPKNIILELSASMFNLPI